MKNKLRRLLLLAGATLMLGGAMKVNSLADTILYSDEGEYVIYSEDEELGDPNDVEIRKAEDLNPATDLKWDSERPGRLSFTLTNTGKVKVEVYVSLNGEPYKLRLTGMNSADDTSKNMDLDLSRQIHESGDYKFKVKLYPYGEKSDNNPSIGCVSAESAVFSYTRPSQQVANVTNVKADSKGNVTWDPISNADYYIVGLHKKVGEKYEFVDGIGIGKNQWNFSTKIAAGNEYYVTIQTCSENITKWANSQVSNYMRVDFSSYVTDKKITDITQSVSVTNAKEVADNLKEAFKETSNKDELRLAMQTSSDTQNKISDLEGKYSEAMKVTGEVTTKDTGIDNSKVSVLGAKLNAKNENSTVSFSIKKPETEEMKEIITATTFTKALGFSMDLEGAGIAPGETLAVPVTVTMPLPEGFDVNNLVIWHYNADGSHELLDVRQNSDGTISFTVNHFSLFVFGDNTAKTDDTKKITTYENTVEGFVKRLYNVVLNRPEDADGLKNWSEKLKSGEAEASQILEGFVNSDEFKNRKLSNDDMVEIMYNAMLGRSSDPNGKKGWVEKLDNGLTINAVVNGFSGSEEFGKLCANYGIKPGSINLSQNRDKNSGVTMFVARCYTKALDRAFDEKGLEDWCGRILGSSNQRQAALDMASNGFFHSEEFGNKNTSNEEYVKILYRTFLGREYDEAGLKDWVGQLDAGKSRDDVMAGFSGSVEFDTIMKSYGL